ncbi:YjjW family glycine radical enzyme activase [Orbaceae bacterium ac157xtp]
MSKLWATVNKILPFSCVDGPGNRLVIFLQGCNFNCLNCHNPYTISLCRDCGDCVKACPHGALSFQHGKAIWHTDQCKQCDTCIKTCTYQSTPMTYRYSVDEILAIIRQYLPFLNGITLSGGEATLQLPFITALFTAIKKADDLKHLSCFIDSNGYLPINGWQKVIEVMDGAMIDLKAWNNQTHQQLTGRDNLRVKESIQYLAEKGKLHEVRLLLIPKQTDLQHCAPELAQFLLTIKPDILVRINAFHTHGVTGIAKTWQSMSQSQVEQFANELTELGITNITLPTVYLA